MSTITTHVLDAVFGKPAPHIVVRLERHTTERWTLIGDGRTDQDGRCRDLCSEANEGTYRLTFFIEAYFTSHDRKSIYPEIVISFRVDGNAHYHIPLLLSDNSYTTYRGS